MSGTTTLNCVILVIVILGGDEVGDAVVRVHRRDREHTAAAQINIIGAADHVVVRRAGHGDGQRDVVDVFVVSVLSRGGHGRP